MKANAWIASPYFLRNEIALLVVFVDVVSIGFWVVNLKEG